VDLLHVLFDTNVWVSAFLFPHSVPGQAIAHARSRHVQSIISEALIEQARGALGRLGFTPAEVDEAAVEIGALSIILSPTITLTVITAKDSDNRVLECAVAGHADLIVTGDRKHLLRLGAYDGIPIVSPADFVRSR
jgi:putative PIN family toxin of toxin-antitoxin system